MELGQELRADSRRVEEILKVMGLRSSTLRRRSSPNRARAAMRRWTLRIQSGIGPWSARERSRVTQRCSTVQREGGLLPHEQASSAGFGEPQAPSLKRLAL